MLDSVNRLDGDNILDSICLDICDQLLPNGLADSLHMEHLEL